MVKIKSNKFTDIAISILEFFLVLVILLECNSVYIAYVGINIDPKVWALRASIIAAFILIALHIVKDRSNIECIKNHKALFYVSFVAVLEFNALNAMKSMGSGFLGYFLFFMNAMVVLYQIYRKENDTFRLIYLLEHVILFIAVASVILWTGSCILELWGRNADILVNWGGRYYDSNYLNLCIRRWYFAGDLTKNLGIFIEPPMFGLFLGFGLYTELFLKKKSNPAIVVTFLIAVLSNRAVLAMMISLVALFFFFIEMIKGRKVARILIPLMFIATACGVIVLFLYKRSTGWGSFATHIDDFAAALKCWVHYPILGCGYDREWPIRQYMSEFRADNQGLSNSAAVVLAEGGIVLFIYYCIPFVLMMSAFFKKNHKLAYWSVGMCLFWVVVIFHTRLFIFFILAFGYAMIDLRVRVRGLKEGEKRVEFSIADIQGNLSEDSKLIHKKMLDLPVGFLAVMSGILSFTSVFGLIHFKRFTMANAIAAVIILIAQCAILFIHLKFYKLSKNQNTMLQTCLWVFYMCFGQPYRVLDYFYTVTKLHIQDVWWHSIAAVTVLYFVGVIINDLLRDKAEESLKH